jgi:hypothetical protein
MLFDCSPYLRHTPCSCLHVYHEDRLTMQNQAS